MQKQMPIRSKCRACGFENPEGFRFCGHCGVSMKQLSDESTDVQDLIEIAWQEPVEETQLEDLIEIDQVIPKAPTGEQTGRADEELTGELTAITQMPQEQETADGQTSVSSSCLVCGLENLPDIACCESCGAVVALSGVDCSECGYRVPRGSLFCDQCGYQVGNADYYESAHYKSARRIT